jgi:hypothetical protein
LPAVTREPVLEVYPVGSGARFFLRGAIRGGVLLTYRLYTVVDTEHDAGGRRHL